MAALRPYQRRATDLCVHSQNNTLVVLPTGSGKTRIAAEIIREVGSPCLMLVPTRHLVEQQAASLRESLGPQVIVEELIGGTGKSDDRRAWWKKLAQAESPTTQSKSAKKLHVLVSTPEKFVSLCGMDELPPENPHVRSVLCSFALIIFDEVHHCLGNHPYAILGKAIEQNARQLHEDEVASCYDHNVDEGPPPTPPSSLPISTSNDNDDVVQSPSAEPRMPQIVGLTATITYKWKKSSINAAVDSILRMLQVGDLFTAGIDELERDGFKPKKDVVCVEDQYVFTGTAEPETSPLAPAPSGKNPVQLFICGALDASNNSPEQERLLVEIVRDLEKIITTLFPQQLVGHGNFPSPVTFVETHDGTVPEGWRIINWGYNAQKLGQDATNMSLKLLFGLLEHWYEAIRIASVGSAGAIDVAMHYLAMNHNADGTVMPHGVPEATLRILQNDIDEMWENAEMVEFFEGDVEKKLEEFKAQFFTPTNEEEICRRPRLEGLVAALSELVEDAQNNGVEVPKTIVFAEQRISTEVIKDYLTKHPDLQRRTTTEIEHGQPVDHLQRFFRVTNTYSRGARAAASFSPMTSVKAKECIALFNRGDANLLVSTGMLEEGYDVPDASVVICFDPVKNTVSYKQSQGRATHHPLAKAKMILLQQVHPGSNDKYEAAHVYSNEELAEAIQRFKNCEEYAPMLKWRRMMNEQQRHFLGNLLGGPHSMITLKQLRPTNDVTRRSFDGVDAADIVKIVISAERAVAVSEMARVSGIDRDPTQLFNELRQDKKFGVKRPGGPFTLEKELVDGDGYGLDGVPVDPPLGIVHHSTQWRRITLCVTVGEEKKLITATAPQFPDYSGGKGATQACLEWALCNMGHLYPPPPAWDGKNYNSIKNTLHPPPSVRAIDFSMNIDEPSVWKRRHVEVVLKDLIAPWKNGGHRHCYRIHVKREDGTSCSMVAKSYKEQRPANATTEFIADVSNQQVAAQIVEDFKKRADDVRRGGSITDVAFLDDVEALEIVPCSLLTIARDEVKRVLPQFTGDSSGKHMFSFQTEDAFLFCVEPELPNVQRYTKYNGNNGRVFPNPSMESEKRDATESYTEQRSKYFEIAEALSHFSYESSGKTRLLNDIQGVELTLTDPQVLTLDDDRTRRGNLGQQGIDNWKKDHQCNTFCRALGLPSLLYSNAGGRGNDNDADDKSGAPPCSPPIQSQLHKYSELQSLAQSRLRNSLHERHHFSATTGGGGASSISVGSNSNWTTTKSASVSSSTPSGSHCKASSSSSSSSSSSRPTSSNDDRSRLPSQSAALVSQPNKTNGIHANNSPVSVTGSNNNNGCQSIPASPPMMSMVRPKHNDPGVIGPPPPSSSSSTRSTNSLQHPSLLGGPGSSSFTVPSSQQSSGSQLQQLQQQAVAPSVRSPNGAINHGPTTPPHVATTTPPSSASPMSFSAPSVTSSSSAVASPSAMSSTMNLPFGIRRK